MRDVWKRLTRISVAEDWLAKVELARGFQRAHKFPDHVFDVGVFNNKTQRSLASNQVVKVRGIRRRFEEVDVLPLDAAELVITVLP
jgi:hypothetical protein